MEPDRFPSIASASSPILEKSVLKRPAHEGFSATLLGDASPENVNSQIAPHLIRMAETRAKARALRDAINASAIPFEELADTGDAGAHLRAQGGGGSSPRPPPIRSAPSGGASGRRSGQDGGQVSAGSGDFPSRAREPKARKSQVDLLKTLAIYKLSQKG